MSRADVLCRGVVGIMCFQPAGEPVAIPGLKDVPLLNACLVVVHYLETSSADLIAQRMFCQVLVITPSEWCGGGGMRCC